MKRLHLFEIHDQDWCPRSIRDAVTDYLQFIVAKTNPYAALVPILAASLRQNGAVRVLDLCSGAGGPWFWLQPTLAKEGIAVDVCLTDKHPNSNVSTVPPISYHQHPVDAMHVPEEQRGFRTLFSGFHHFRPDEARSILADSVKRREGIAIFEGMDRSFITMLAMLLVPLMILVATPFIRPFRWSRLLWTYLIPIIPLVGMFDGMVSSLRIYSVEELRELTQGLGANDYHWQTGTLKSNSGPIPITYLIGLPTGDQA